MVKTNFDLYLSTEELKVNNHDHHYHLQCVKLILDFIVNVASAIFNLSSSLG